MAVQAAVAESDPDSWNTSGGVYTIDDDLGLLHSSCSPEMSLKLIPLLLTTSMRQTILYTLATA